MDMCVQTNETSYVQSVNSTFQFHNITIVCRPLSTPSFSLCDTREQWFSTMVMRNICVSLVPSDMSSNNSKPLLWAFGTCNLALFHTEQQFEYSRCVDNFLRTLALQCWINKSRRGKKERPSNIKIFSLTA